MFEPLLVVHYQDSPDANEIARAISYLPALSLADRKELNRVRSIGELQEAAKRVGVEVIDQPDLQLVAVITTAPVLA